MLNHGFREYDKAFGTGNDSSVQTDYLTAFRIRFPIFEVNNKIKFKVAYKHRNAAFNKSR